MLKCPMRVANKVYSRMYHEPGRISDTPSSFNKRVDLVAVDGLSDKAFVLMDVCLLEESRASQLAVTPD